MSQTNVSPLNTVSWLRGRLIQEYFSRKTKNPKTLLCIPGIDSFFDSVSFSCLNYIFPRLQEVVSKLSSTLNEDEGEAVEDIMLMLDENGISLYCNPYIYKDVISLLAGFNRLRIFCLNDEKYSNADHAEDYKINCLVHFTNSYNDIFIPYTTNDYRGNVNPIEKWPLIQAYAIEDYGKHGFFCLKHEVSNFSEILTAMNREIMDYQYLNSHTFYKSLTAFSVQWTNVASIFTTALENVTLLEQVDVVEPFRSYVVHGFTKSNTSNFDVFRYCTVMPSFSASLSLKVCSQLLFGFKDDYFETHQCKSTEYMRLCTNGGSVVVFLKSSSPPFLAAGRTYFVNSATVSGGLSQHKNLYKCLVEAVELAVAEQNQENAETVFLHSLRSKIAANIKDEEVKFKHVFAIEEFERSKVIDHLTLPRSKYVLAAVKFEEPAEIGVLLFADTFLPIQIASSNGGIYCSKTFWLTNSINRYLDLHPNSSYMSFKEDNSITLTGSQQSIMAYFPKENILFPDTISVLSIKFSLSSLDMSLQLSNGVDLDVDGSLDLIDIKCFDQSSPPFDFEAILLEIKFSIKNHNNSKFPFETSTNDGDNLIIVGFQTKTLPHREFRQRILPQWNQIGGNVPHLSAPTRAMQRFSDITSSHIKNSSGATSLPNEFLINSANYIKISEIQLIAGSKYYPPKRELDLTFSGVSVDEPKTDANLINVYILSAMPEVNVDAVVNSILKKKSGDEAKSWLGTYALYPDSTSSGVYSTKVTQVEFDFDRFRKFLADKTPSNLDLPFKSNALVVSPFFVNLQCLIARLEENTSFSMNGIDFELKVKSVLLCIDGYSDATLANRSINPILQDQLKPGLCSGILAFCPTGRSRDGLKGQNFETVNRIARSLNPSIAVYRHAVDVDFDQMPSFWSKQLSLHRSLFWTDVERSHFKNRQSSNVCFTQSAHAVTLTFKQRSLQKDKLTAHLYMLAKLANGPSFIHHEEDQPIDSQLEDFTSKEWTVWHVAGEIGFAHSEDLVRISFTLPQQVFRVQSLPKDKQNSNSFFLTFYGENLDEATLKQWLRQSAISRQPQKSLLSLEELAPAFWTKLQTERHLDPLPEGWYYNGTYYVNQFGDKSYRHPSLKEFAQSYVESHNAEVEKANLEARQAKIVDLFG